MRTNITISLEPWVAELVEKNAEKMNISKSKYINDVLKADQKTPRQKVSEVEEILESKDLNSALIGKVVSIIKENLPKI